MAKRYGELVQDLWNGHFKSITPLKFRVSYIFPAIFTNCEYLKISQSKGSLTFLLDNDIQSIIVVHCVSGIAYFLEHCILVLARRGCLANCIHDNYVFYKNSDNLRECLLYARNSNIVQQ